MVAGAGVRYSGSSTITGGWSQDQTAETYPTISAPAALTGLVSSGDKILTAGATLSLNGDYKYNSISLSDTSQINVTGNTRLYLTKATTALSMISSSKIDVASGAKLTIYTLGNVILNDNAQISDSSNKPAQCVLYSATSNATGVDLTDYSNFYGAVYAPTTTIQLGGQAEIFGAAIGKRVIVGTNASSIHYDEALAHSGPARCGSGLCPYVFQSWKEN